MTIQRADLSSFASTLARADVPVERPLETPRAGETGGANGAGGAGTVDFAERVSEVLNEVNEVQVQAGNAAEGYANGTQNDMHGTMIALEQADITFRLVSNVRSRLVEAYREVMRMGA